MQNIEYIAAVGWIIAVILFINQARIAMKNKGTGSNINTGSRVGTKQK